MISCLIFTKDNADAVTKQIKLVSQYVDEVVVICSDWECKRKIKYACPFAIIHYMPPVGYVEAYYRAGIDSCRYNWIFMLDDDEIPSDNLLRAFTHFREIENLPFETNLPPHVYSIKRIEKNGSTCYVPRFFHKNAVFVTALIHRGLKPIQEPLKLIERCYLTHTSEYTAEKSKRYAKIEAKQYPDIIKSSAENCKALRLFYFFVSSIHRVMTAPNKKDTLIYCWHVFKELVK
jgi:hypothetical protein